MKNDPSIREKLEKLPQWSQSYIADLIRQREEAIHTLNQFQDTQTPSGVTIRQDPCTGEQCGPSKKIQYLQTNRVEFCHAGVVLSVSLTRPDDSQRNYGIELSFRRADDRGIVAVHPRGYGTLELLAKENLR